MISYIRSWDKLKSSLNSLASYARRKAMDYSVKLVVKDKMRDLSMFLIIVNRQAYLVNYDSEKKDFGFMCPCCVIDSQRKNIADAVQSALDNNLFDGKVRWCCHKSDSDYGDHLNTTYSHLRQELFCSGSANADLAEVKNLIHEAVVDLQTVVASQQ